MNKTIRIDNLRDVQIGDMLFVEGRSDGFRVACTQPIGVDSPFGYGIAYISKNKFDHAERTIEEPEWPQPSDRELHIYLGADGKKYLYMPSYERDVVPWHQLPYYRINSWHDAEGMTECYPTALPLKELKFVPEEEES